MDDFLIFGSDKRALRGWLGEIREFVNEHLLLDLKEKALIVAPVWQGIPFLGFRVFPGTVRLDKKCLKRFRRKTRQRERQYHQGQIDEDFLVNSVRSMVAHVSHANTYMMRKGFFADSLNLG
jgi:RNA-directed DNA polymerase